MRYGDATSDPNNEPRIYSGSISGMKYIEISSRETTEESVAEMGYGDATSDPNNEPRIYSKNLEQCLYLASQINSKKQSLLDERGEEFRKLINLEYEKIKYLKDAVSYFTLQKENLETQEINSEISDLEKHIFCNKEEARIKVSHITFNDNIFQEFKKEKDSEYQEIIEGYKYQLSELEKKYIEPDLNFREASLFESDESKIKKQIETYVVTKLTEKTKLVTYRPPCTHVRNSVLPLGYYIDEDIDPELVKNFVTNIKNIKEKKWDLLEELKDNIRRTEFTDNEINELYKTLIEEINKNQQSDIPKGIIDSIPFNDDQKQEINQLAQLHKFLKEGNWKEAEQIIDKKREKPYPPQYSSQFLSSMLLGEKNYSDPQLQELSKKIFTADAVDKIFFDYIRFPNDNDVKKFKEHLKVFDPNSKNKNGDTALTVAIYNKKYNFAKIILETEGFSEIDARGIFGTALDLIKDIEKKNQTPPLLSEIKEMLETRQKGPGSTITDHTTKKDSDYISI